MPSRYRFLSAVVGALIVGACQDAATPTAPESPADASAEPVTYTDPSYSVDAAAGGGTSVLVASPFRAEVAALSVSGSSIPLQTIDRSSPLRTTGLVTFETLPNYDPAAASIPPLGTFAGMQFGEGWVVNISMADPTVPRYPTVGGSTGNFTNAPSGTRALFWFRKEPTASKDPIHRYQDFLLDRPVSEVTLWYSSCLQSTITGPDAGFFGWQLPPEERVVVITAYDANGAVVTNEGTAAGENNCFIGSTTNPTFAFRNWNQLVVRSTDNTIRRIRVRGYRNLVALDDISWIQKNYQPRALPGGPYTTSEATAFQVTGSASFDPVTAGDTHAVPGQDQIASYLWDFGGGVTASTPNASHTFVGSGQKKIYLTVTDLNGVTHRDSAVVNVANVSPLIRPIAPITTPSNQAVTIAGQFEDPGTEDMPWIAEIAWGDGTMSADTINSWAALMSFSRSRSYTTPGSYTAIVTVRDRDGGQTSQSVAVTVQNQPPTARFEAPTGGKEGSSVQFDGTASTDPENGVLTHAWSYGDGNTGSGATPTHTYAQPGSYTVRLTVTDPAQGSHFVERTVVIANVLPTATFNTPSAPVVEGTTYTISLTGPTDPSTGAGEFRYAFDCGGGGALTFGTASSASCTAPAVSSGSVTVTGAVRDRDGGVTEYTRTLTLAPANQPPTISMAGSYGGNEGSSVAFGWSAQDEDGDALQYSWSFGDGGTGSGTAPPASHVYRDDGSYTVSLTVSDGKAPPVTRTATVTIADVLPGVSLAATSPVSTETGNEIVLAATFTDPGQDDGPWSYTVNWGNGASTPVQLTSLPATVTLSHLYTTPYTGPVTVTVRDRQLVSGSAQQGVVVKQANRAPVVTASVASAIVQCSAGTGSVQLVGTASDADGDPLTYRWYRAGVGTPVATTLSATVSLPLGTHQLTLRASDGKATGEASTSATVKDEVAPTLSVSASPGYIWPPNHKYETVTVTVSASDACAGTTGVTYSGYVVSNQPDDANGNGDGGTEGDIRVTRPNGQVLTSSSASPQVPFRPGDKLEVRSERAGGNEARIYSIRLRATDPSQNTSGYQVATVRIDHDRGND